MGAPLERALLRFLNGAGRVFGALCLVAGLAFVAGGMFTAVDRLLNLGAGAFLLVIGVAFLVVKPARQDDLQRMRGLRPPKDSTDQRGPDEWQA